MSLVIGKRFGSKGTGGQMRLHGEAEMVSRVLRAIGVAGTSR